MQWLAENQIPFVIVFTKTDKITKNRATKNIEKYKLEMLKKWVDIPKIFITSAKNKTGIMEVLKYIGTLNNQF